MGNADYSQDLGWGVGLEQNPKVQELCSTAVFPSMGQGQPEGLGIHSPQRSRPSLSLPKSSSKEHRRWHENKEFQIWGRWKGD